METDAALVRANGFIELHAIAEVGLNLAAVIDPCHAECDDTVGLDHALDDACFFEFRVLVVDIGYRDKDFLHGLQILFFSRMLCFQRAHDGIYIHS